MIFTLSHCHIQLGFLCHLTSLSFLLLELKQPKVMNQPRFTAFGTDFEATSKETKDIFDKEI